MAKYVTPICAAWLRCTRFVDAAPTAAASVVHRLATAVECNPTAIRTTREGVGACATKVHLQVVCRAHLTAIRNGEVVKSAITGLVLITLLVEWDMQVWLTGFLLLATGWALEVRNASHCQQWCSGRGTCVSWPSQPQFPALCVCDKTYWGPSCAMRQSNPYSRTLSSERYETWRGQHGVNCGAGRHASACQSCPSPQPDDAPGGTRECGGECTPAPSNASDCIYHPEAGRPARSIRNTDALRQKRAWANLRAEAAGKPVRRSVGRVQEIGAGSRAGSRLPPDIKFTARKRQGRSFQGRRLAAGRVRATAGCAHGPLLFLRIHAPSTVPSSASSAALSSLANRVALLLNITVSARTVDVDGAHAYLAQRRRFFPAAWRPRALLLLPDIGLTSAHLDDVLREYANLRPELPLRLLVATPPHDLLAIGPQASPTAQSMLSGSHPAFQLHQHAALSTPRVAMAARRYPSALAAAVRKVADSMTIALVDLEYAIRQGGLHVGCKGSARAHAHMPCRQSRARSCTHGLPAGIGFVSVGHLMSRLGSMPPWRHTPPKHRLMLRST